MPTTGKGYPYPAVTDPVAATATAIQSLASACDSRAAISASGKITVNVNNAVSGSKSVTFPSGRFGTNVPNVVGCPQNSLFAASVGAPSATGFTAYVRHVNNNSTDTDVPYHYIARTTG